MDQVSLNDALRSILQASPAAPYSKVLAASLLVYGENIPELAIRLDRKYPHVNGVIQGKRQSVPLRQRIADLLGVAVTDIWAPDFHVQGAE